MNREKNVTINIISYGTINNDNWDYWQDEMCYSPYDGTCGDKEGFKHLGGFAIKTPKWFIDNFTYTEDKSIINTLNDYVNGNICMKNDDLLKELEILMNWRNDKKIDTVLNNKITELRNHAQ